MDIQNLKKAAQHLQSKARNLMDDPAVQELVDNGRQYVDRGKDWLENGDGKKYVDKGKEMFGDAKGKLEDFVEDKTDGKGIFGFGKKNE